MKFRKCSRRRRVFDLLLLLCIPVLFYACADSVIFQPPECSYRPSAHLLLLATEDGHTIAAYYLPPPDDEGAVVLYSHGNAEDIGQLRPFLQHYHLQGFGILAWDYRGYGLSDGRASEQATYADIEAVYHYLTDHEQIVPARILIHGRSVGCGPSVWLACRKPAGGLILESPFLSAYRVVTRIPLIPFDKYDNLGRIQNVHCPVLFIHGRDDRVVPFWHGETLYESANQPKTNYWVDCAGHNDLVDKAGKTYWNILQDFKAKTQTAQNPGE